MATWKEVFKFLQKNNAGTFVSFSNRSENEGGYSSSFTIKSKIDDNSLLITFTKQDDFIKHALNFQNEDLCLLSIISIDKSPSILNNLGMIINLECKFIKFEKDEEHNDFLLLIEVININVNNNLAQK